MKTRGNALSEYGIMLATVAIVLIGGLILVGGAIQNALTGTADGLLNSQARTTQVLGNRGVPGGDSGTEISGAGATGATGLPVVLTPTELKRSVETAGANGTTELLANQIRQMADQLKAGGKIDDAQYKLFGELEQQARRMAEMEGYIESRSQSSPTINEWAQSGIAFEGRDLSPQDFVLMLCPQRQCGYTASGGASVYSEDYPVTEPMRYQKIYNELEASGAFADPEVRNAISQLSNQVLDLANAVNQAGFAVWMNDNKPGEFSGLMANKVSTH